MLINLHPFCTVDGCECRKDVACLERADFKQPQTAVRLRFNQNTAHLGLDDVTVGLLFLPAEHGEPPNNRP